MISIKDATRIYTENVTEFERKLKALNIQPSVLISPYIYTWGYKNSVYKVNNCVDAFKRGVQATNIAFVTGDSCDGVIKTIREDVLKFQELGGKATVSFGGASGRYMEELLTEDEMVGQVMNLTSLTGIKSFDFDIEGPYIVDTVLHAKRDRIIQKLQNKIGGVKIMFTLPADRNGLSPAGLQLLKASKCNIDMVNIMAMDIGPVENWGETAKLMCEVTAKQLEQIFPTKPIYKMLGVTAMIGRNDDGSIFKVEDAKFLGNYAREKGLGMVSYWALNRDQPGTGDLSVYSQTNKIEMEYFTAFNGK